MFRDTLVERFEAGTVDNSAFSHADHIFVIWSLIHTYGTLEAIRRFETGLKRITFEAGSPEKYNCTITYALGFLAGERIADDPSRDWRAFVHHNSDLMEWPNEQLTYLYPNGILHTEHARRVFLLPRANPCP